MHVEWIIKVIFMWKVSNYLYKRLLCFKFFFSRELCSQIKREIKKNIVFYEKKDICVVWRVILVDINMSVEMHSVWIIRSKSCIFLR